MKPTALLFVAIACALGCGMPAGESPPDDVGQATSALAYTNDYVTRIRSSFPCTIGYDTQERPIQDWWTLIVSVRQQYGVFESRTGPGHFNPQYGYMDTVVATFGGPEWTNDANIATLECIPASFMMRETPHTSAGYVLYNDAPLSCTLYVHDAWTYVDQTRSVPVTIAAADWQMLAQVDGVTSPTWSVVMTLSGTLDRSMDGRCNAGGRLWLYLEP
jgi:hypothetical protein